MTRYQYLRLIGCNRSSAAFIACLNWIRGVPKNRIVFATVDIELTDVVPAPEKVMTSKRANGMTDAILHDIAFAMFATSAVICFLEDDLVLGFLLACISIAFRVAMRRTA